MDSHTPLAHINLWQRKAAAFDHIASLKTEWSGHCCNGKGEYTFIPDVEAFEPYEPTECASAPTLLEAVEMTMGRKESDRESFEGE